MPTPTNLTADTPALASVLRATARGWRPFPLDHPSHPDCIGKRCTRDRADWDGHDNLDCPPGLHEKRGKHPVGHWPTQTATAQTPAMLRMWFGNKPVNVGIACKPSGLVVLDEDDLDSLERFAAELGEALPRTYRVRTSRGWHYYFSVPDGATIGNRTGALKARHIDVRGGVGDGGYVVAAGSTHVSGHVYTAEDESAPLVELPAWLIAQINACPDGTTEGSATYGPGETRAGTKAQLVHTYRKHLEQVRTPGFEHSFFTAARDGWRLVNLGVLPKQDVITDLHQVVQRTWRSDPDIGDRKLLKQAQAKAQASPWELIVRPAGGPEPDKPDADPEVNEEGPEQHHGQLRFAERFTRAYAGKFLHAHGIGWHAYDSTRWAECKDGGETRAVVALVKDALYELPALDPDGRKDLFKDIQRCESAAGINGVLELARNLHPCTVAAEQLDADRYLLNTASGTVNLRDGKIRACSPADRLSKVTVGRFDPDATSDVFDEFLSKVQPDPEMRGFLARSLGAALLGHVRDHVLLIWYGVGANGKGTLRDAVRHAMGDYAVEVPAEILLVNRHGQQALAPERMRLRGARVAFCSEIANGAKLDEATMKKLTGGDPVNAKLLYRNPIEFDPSHTLFMLTNHLPQVRGDDPATWRRIQAVPWDVVVPAGKRDGKLPEKLKAAADAVLAWMWAGWLDYQHRGGLHPPQVVVDATRKYREDSDLLARFLSPDAGVVVVGHGSVLSAALYERFKRWCSREGEEQQLSNKAFTEQLEKHGFKRQRTKLGAQWLGVMIASDEDDDSHGESQ